MQLTLFAEPPTLRVPVRAGRADVQERRVKSILAKGTGVLAGVDYTLNPYVGCQFACTYCYAAYFQAPGPRRDEWGKWVEVKANALDKLKRERGLAGATLMIGSVTDAYQPIERETRLTRSLLEHLATIAPQPKIHIQTRSPFVADDIDILRRFDRLTVGMSITTDDELVRKAFEPQCASIERRMETIERLHGSRIRTAVSISPMLPVSDPETFARQLRDLGCEKYSCGWFHENRGDFASGTRPGAWALAKAHGWDRSAYDDTVRRMQSVLPQLKSWSR